MIQKDEGYIKFNCHFIEAAPLAADALIEINQWRNRLYQLGLIGAYEDGIGFGNISVRSEGKHFIISGSGTGNISELDENHYVLVNGYDFEKNTLTCIGPIRASSESLSHAAVYESSPEIMAVIHIHNLQMWEQWLDKIPTTRKDISFGTPEMAWEIKRVYREAAFGEAEMIVMGGHREGVLAFGKTLDEAGQVIMHKLPQ